MAGILDIMRAAIPHVAAARGGYLQGQEKGRQVRRAEDVESASAARQARMDQQEKERYEAEQRRQGELDKQNSLIAQSRMAHEKASAERERATAGYYESGGATKRETPDAVADRYIQAAGGDPEKALLLAANEIEGRSAGSFQKSGLSRSHFQAAAARLKRQQGLDRSVMAQRTMGGELTYPSGETPETQGGPVSQTRAATGAPTAPKPPVDTNAIFRKYGRPE